MIDEYCQSRIRFCIHAFHRVKSVTIKQSDFNSISVSGLYMYYKPVLQQAKSILTQKYYSYTNENGSAISKSVFTIPYMINMETLFEFYARTILKDILDQKKYEIDAYSKKWFLVHGVSKPEEIEKGIHLIPYCIPDIIIRDRCTNNVLVVMDAKYKAHDRAMREDSLQLLSYVLITGAEKCGFIFPGEESKVKMMATAGLEYLQLETPFPVELKYYELLISDTPDNEIFEWVLQ